MEQRPNLDEVMKAAEGLDPDDRLRLIARLWQSLPEDHWAAPVGRDRAVVRQALADDDMAMLADVPRRVAMQVLGTPPAEKIYSAPRRFDLAMIFVVTFAYSLLFALMSGVGFPPEVSLVVGGFITVVGVGQALLFGGKNPRLASIITGAVASIPITVISVMMTSRGFRGDEIFIAIPTSVMVGVLAGYITGVLVGGVFLIADKIRTAFARRTATAAGVITTDESDLG